MADNRVKIDISVTGADGKVREIDWWINWDETVPIRVFNAMVALAEASQLPVDYTHTDL